MGYQLGCASPRKEILGNFVVCGDSCLLDSGQKVWKAPGAVTHCTQYI